MASGVPVGFRIGQFMLAFCVTQSAKVTTRSRKLKEEGGNK